MDVNTKIGNMGIPGGMPREGMKAASEKPAGSLPTDGLITSFEYSHSKEEHFNLGDKIKEKFRNARINVSSFVDMGGAKITALTGAVGAGAGAGIGALAGASILTAAAIGGGVGVAAGVGIMAWLMNTNWIL